MNQKIYGLTALLFGLLLLACNGPKNTAGQDDALQAVSLGDNSQTSVDWAGVYQGLLPCADCPGISTVVILNQDRTYELRTQYLERGDSIYTESGAFEWNAEGSRITLTDSDNRRFQVGENQIFHLDMEGNRIDGELASHYVLRKVDINPTDVYWKLIELQGQSVEDIETMKEPYIRFNSSESRVEGTGGCNGFGGSYTMEDFGKISMSQLMSTKMACPNMDIEYQFMTSLEKVERYSQNADTLQLFTSDDAAFAKFVAVYGKF